MLPKNAFSRFYLFIFSILFIYLSKIIYSKLYSLRIDLLKSICMDINNRNFPGQYPTNISRNRELPFGSEIRRNDPVLYLKFPVDKYAYTLNIVNDRT